MINKRDVQIVYFFILSVQLTDQRLIDNLKYVIDTALAKNLSDESSTDLLINQLSRILEEEEGLQIVNQTVKYLNRVDGSGEDVEDEEYPPFYTNMSIFTDPFVSYDIIDQTIFSRLIMTDRESLLSESLFHDQRRERSKEYVYHCLHHLCIYLCLFLVINKQ